MFAAFFEAAYSDEERKRTFVYIVGLIGLAVCMIMLVANLGTEPKSLFAKAVVIDNFSTSMKMIMVLGTLGTFYISYKSNDIYESLKSEYLVMALEFWLGECCWHLPIIC